jgi:hypothetical protein
MTPITPTRPIVTLLILAAVDNAASYLSKDASIATRPAVN